MNDKPTLEELLEVQEYFGLPSLGLVEKDWHVVRALAAIAAVDPGEFRLVFGGGTALSRAYKLTKRMSEDVDLKIVCKTNPSRGALRKLRTDITDPLLKAGFEFDPESEKHRVSMYKATTLNTCCPINRLRKEKACAPTFRSRPRCGRCGVTGR